MSVKAEPPYATCSPQAQAQTFFIIIAYPCFSFKNTENVPTRKSLLPCSRNSLQIRKRRPCDFDHRDAVFGVLCCCRRAIREQVETVPRRRADVSDTAAARAAVCKLSLRLRRASRASIGQARCPAVCGSCAEQPALLPRRKPEA